MLCITRIEHAIQFDNIAYSWRPTFQYRDKPLCSNNLFVLCKKIQYTLLDLGVRTVLKFVTKIYLNTKYVKYYLFLNVLGKKPY